MACRLNRNLLVGIAVAWESLFLFDCTIFSLTLFKTLRERRRNPVTSGRRDIVSLVMRDGASLHSFLLNGRLSDSWTSSATQVPCTLRAFSSRSLPQHMGQS